jgi:hypothetical protein
MFKIRNTEGAYYKQYTDFDVNPIGTAWYTSRKNAETKLRRMIRHEKYRLGRLEIAVKGNPNLSTALERCRKTLDGLEACIIVEMIVAEKQ